VREGVTANYGLRTWEIQGEARHLLMTNDRQGTIRPSGKHPAGYLFEWLLRKVKEKKRRVTWGKNPLLLGWAMKTLSTND